MIIKETAYSIASSYGSYVRSGDPGACFYCFYYRDGRPISEAHRLDCLMYLEGLIDRHKQKTGRRPRSLEALRRFLKTSPLRPGASRE